MDEMDLLNYHWGRADAAMERLKLAVEALKDMDVTCPDDELNMRLGANHANCVTIAREALKQIGDLP